MDGTFRLVESGRSTATAYRFRGIYTGKDGVEHSEGWAICTVNDATGELSIQSDWTDGCGHRWPVQHLGSPSLTHFLADRAHFDYLVGKLLPVQRREQFSPERTIAKLREQILRNRRGNVSRGGSRLTKDAARDLWDDLEAMYHEDARDFFDALDDDYRDTVFSCPEAEFWMVEPTREAKALEGWILPALSAACADEVRRRQAADEARARTVADWNERNPIGTCVLVNAGDGLERTATAGPARVDGDRTLIPLWGQSGSYGERDVETPVDMRLVFPLPREHAFTSYGKHLLYKGGGVFAEVAEVSEYEMVVNRHQMLTLLERFADLAYEANRLTIHAPNVLIKSIRDDLSIDFAVEDCDPAIGAAGLGAGGVWVHDPTAPHPCEYACGAVHIERTKDKIEATLGTETITFEREQDDEEPA